PKRPGGRYETAWLNKVLNMQGIHGGKHRYSELENLQTNGAALKAEREEEDRRLTRMLSMEEDGMAQPRAVGFFPSVAVITKRSANQWLRDQDLFASEVSQYLFYGVFIGLLYFGVNAEVSACCTLMLGANAHTFNR